MAAPVFQVAGSNNANATSVTISGLVVAGNANRVMWIFTFDTNLEVPTVTWNGVSVGAAVETGTFDSATDGWRMYRVLLPTATTADVVATFATTGQKGLIAFVYDDVDQTDPEDAIEEGEGSGTALQKTAASAVGDTCILVARAVGTTTMTEASGETERSDVGTGAARLYELAGGASLSFDVTLGTSRVWVALGMNINAVAAGVTTRRYSLPLTGVG